MELKELKRKPIVHYNPVYDNAGDGLPALKSDIFQLMEAEELNPSHYLEIEEDVKQIFPIIETHGYVVRLKNMGIELSGRVARVTCNVIIDYTDSEDVGKNNTHTRKCVIYTYKYRNVWYVL